ncbi:MAG: ribose-phosphate pyrophosphokinase-like domain-containing protein, partial [Phycisphaerales bacterium]|nr:ribose-phosphate pyrophosphokinase-like domain-containing protein [Phycisphaerales bacterium]
MTIDHDHLKIFGGRAGHELAGEVCEHLDLPQGVAQTDLFPDGELIVRVDEDVRGRDCYIVQS